MGQLLKASKILALLMWVSLLEMLWYLLQNIEEMSNRQIAISIGSIIFILLVAMSSSAVKDTHYES